MYLKSITSLTFSVLCSGIIFAAEQTPDADQLLRQMSAKLAAAQIFSFEAEREIDASLIEGAPAAVKARVSAVVQRPNKLAVIAKSASGVRRFVADGSTLTLFDGKMNFYSVIPMQTSIDGLVEKVDKVYGFTAPLAEFAISDPYKDFLKQAKSVSYLGRGRTSHGLLGLFGVECHRLWLAGKDADAELWIGVHDQLPYRLDATFHREGQPKVHIDFLKWNLTAKVTAGEFTFTPPNGSQKIDMVSSEKMQSAGKK